MTQVQSLQYLLLDALKDLLVQQTATASSCH